jgi:gliding motility-associated-like protein
LQELTFETHHTIFPMQRAVLVLLLFFLNAAAMAQKQFIRTNNNQNFGADIRTASTPNDGWIVFSADSLKMLRFDRCMQVQYSLQYFLPNDLPASNDIVAIPNNGCAILTQKIAGNAIAPVVTCIDSLGGILWCKSFANSDTCEFACSISSDSSGFIYLSSNTFTDGIANNVLTKISSNGNVISEKILNHGSINSDVIATSDNGFLYRSGNCFVKCDANGNVTWSMTINPSASTFSKPVETGNGFVFTANVTLSGEISLMKLGIHGNLVAQKRTDFFGQAPDLKLKKDRRIGGLFLRTINGINYPTMIDLDSNLNIISQNSNNFYSFSTSLKALDMSIMNDNSAVIAGITSPAGSLFFGRTDAGYYTGCDTMLQPIQTIGETATQSPVSVTFSSCSHIITDIQVYANTFSDSQIVICSVPEQICIGGDSIICGSHPAFLTNVANGIFDSFMWSTGDTTDSLLVDKADQYWLICVGRCGLDTLHDTIDVIKRELITADLGSDRFRCEDNSFELKGPECERCSYLWNDGSRGQTMNVHTNGYQWLKVENDGCISIDSMNVLPAKCECKFFMPNSITPNHDGINDVLKPAYYCDLKDYSMRIFNRWGSLIYMTDDVEQAWDGKIFNILVPPDVYVYKICFMSMMEGAEYEEVTRSGTVSVVY